MKAVELTISTGQVVLVDADDVDRLSRYTWHCITDTGGRSVQDGVGHGQLYYVKGGPVNGMARFILGLIVGDGLHAHHVNDNCLDMRKANLQALTPDEHVQIHHERWEAGKP